MASIDESLNTLCDQYERDIEQFLEIASLVGDENVIVRPYERRQFVERHLLADFLSIFDIEWRDISEQLVFDGDEEVNKIKASQGDMRIFPLQCEIFSVSQMNPESGIRILIAFHGERA